MVKRVVNREAHFLFNPTEMRAKFKEFELVRKSRQIGLDSVKINYKRMGGLI